jgi:hypothetical protein
MILFARFNLFLSMNRKSLIATIVFSVLLIWQLKAQRFGGNPTSLKFYQLNTDTVRIIFPKGLEKQAREAAWLSHQLVRDSFSSSLGNKLRKFNVLLQNQTTTSNAYVGPAPWRSEFYMMPDLTNIGSGALPWHQYLALHEFRHIEQFSNFDRTIPKIAGFFFGQEGKAVAMNLAVPDWFWEGDAVWQETINSKQGRGRFPSFFNSYRSLWLANKNYSYQKLRNGSYRHFVPNHYDLGYLLVSYGREKYGNNLWTKVNNDALDFKGLFYPYQKAVKRHTGVKYKQFVNDAFNWYKDEMNVKETSVFKSLQSINKPVKNSVVNYEYPFITDDGSVLVLKSGYRQIPRWVRIHTNGHEEKLRVKDIAEDSYYSYRDGKVAYTAFATDARWGYKTYSVLKVWDTRVNEVKKISSKTRLFQPDLSPDATSVVAVNSGTDQQTNLRIVQLNDNTVVDLPNPGEYVYTFPRFSADGSSIISAVRNIKGEMALLQTTVSSKQEELLLPLSNAMLAYVQVSGDTVLFTSSQNGADVLYLFDVKTKKLFRAADLPNGNYQATLDQKSQTIIWNTFTADGSLLLKQKLSDVKLKQETPPAVLSNLYLSGKTFAATDLLKNVQQQPGEIKRYRAGTGLLNIHSWRPFAEDPDYGITFYSQNILNTFVGEYAYTYNRNEGYNRVSADLIYGGLYPQLSIGASQTWNRNFALNEDTTITFNQTNLNAGFNIPLNFTGGSTYKNLNLFASYNTEQFNFTGIAKKIYKDQQFNYINTGFSWIVQSQKARQQIFPKWANTISLRYRRTTDGQLGNQLQGNIGLYVPGLFRNHSLSFFATGFARDTLRGSVFSNNFPFARGYQAFNYPRMWRFSTNYQFPVAYPEFGIANMIYFLRVRANLFYDYTAIKSLRTGNVFPFESVGGELFFDTRLWNVQPFSFGVRYSYLLSVDELGLNRNPHQFELVLPLDLF